MNRGPSIEELPGPKVNVIAPTPLQPINTLNLSLLARARGALQDPCSTVGSFNKYNKDTLRALCEERQIPYSGKSQKLDLIEKLFVAVSYLAWKHFETSDRYFSLVGLSNILAVTSLW
jgi:hypothetical protein